MQQNFDTFRNVEEVTGRAAEGQLAQSAGISFNFILL
jgi:hypothetical protein